MYFLLLSVFVATTSCNFTEELHLNKNGSGKISIQVNMSEFMNILGSSTKDKKEKVIDSTVVFKEFLEEKKDSISKLPLEEQKKLKKLENFILHMVMNPKTEEMNVDMFTEFKNTNELTDIFAAFQNVNSLDKPQKSETDVFDELTETMYSYDKKIFKRTTTILDKEAYQKQTANLNNESAPFFEESTYTMKYHFPKKIKSVSNDKVTITNNKKTLTYEVPFTDYLKNPELLNIEVKF